jgi:hypothetical protein
VNVWIVIVHDLEAQQVAQGCLITSVTTKRVHWSMDIGCRLPSECSRRAPTSTSEVRIPSPHDTPPDLALVLRDVLQQHAVLWQTQ